MPELARSRRVVHVINTLDVGGAELGVLRLVDLGFYDAVQLEVVALARGGALLAPALEERAGRLRWRVILDGPLTTITAIASLPRLIRALRDVKPDAVVLSLPQANVVGRLAALLAGVPRVVTFEHSIGLRRPYLTAALAITSLTVTAVLYDTAATARGARRRYLGRQRDGWHELPLFSQVRHVDVRPVRRTPPFVVLTVARLESAKNLVAAVEAMRLLRDAGLDVQYRIVGEGSLRSTLESAVGRHGLQDRVELLGHVANWSQEAATADLYLQPSLREGQCVAALEAMGLGLPVVATPVGGLLDHARHAALHLTGGAAAEDLATGVRSLLEDPEARFALSGRGAAYVEAAFGRGMLERRMAEAALSLGSGS